MYKKNTNRTIVLLLCDNRAKGVRRERSFAEVGNLGNSENLGRIEKNLCSDILHICFFYLHLHHSNAEAKVWKDG